MAKYQDIATKEVFEIGSPDLNPDLIKGKVQVPETTPLGVINVSSLSQPSQPIQVPTPTTLTVPDTTSGQGMIDYFNKLFTAPEAKPPDLTSLFDKYFKTSGVSEAQKDILAKQTVSKAAQDKLAAFNAQLAGITAEQQAIPIRLQKEAEGRGITEGGLAPIQTGQLRDLALRAIPLQAQTLVAQAEAASAQGDVALSQQALSLAQDRFNTLFQVVSKDTENQYNYWKDLRGKAWDFATVAQQNQLNKQQKEDDRKYQLYRDTISDASQKGNALLATQPDLAAKIYARIGKSTGINDATLASDVAVLVGQAEPSKTDVTPTTYVPGSNPAVDNWARLIIAGQAKITDVPNPRGSTLRTDVTNAIASSGQLLLSNKDREKLSTLDTAVNVANTIKSLSEKINTFNVGGRITGYLSRYLGGATQYNEDIARFDAAREGFVSNVARTLGEKGTLAEGDVRRAIANLPTRNDTKGVAEGKLKILFSILEGTRNSIIQKSTEPLTSITSGTLPQNIPETLRTKYNY